MSGGPELARYYDLANQALQLAAKVSDRAMYTIKRRKIHPLKAGVFLGLLRKAHCSLKGVVLLCQNGLPKESFALMRALVETLIHLGTLEDDKNMELVLRYFYFSQWKTRKMYVEARDVPCLEWLPDVVPADYFSELESDARRALGSALFKQRPPHARPAEGAEADELMNRLGTAAWEQLRTADYWPESSSNPRKGAGPLELCKRSMADALYTLHYRLSSHAIHALDVTDYLAFKIAGEACDLAPADTRWTTSSLSSSMFFLVLCTAVVSRTFAKDTEPEVGALQARMQHLMAYSAAPETPPAK
jgi:hypothetical protein